MDKDTLEAAAKVCESWARKLSYGAGYALITAAEDIRALAHQAGDERCQSAVPQNAAPQMTSDREADVSLTREREGGRTNGTCATPAVAAPLSLLRVHVLGNRSAAPLTLEQAIERAASAHIEYLWMRDQMVKMRDRAVTENQRAEAAEAQVAALRGKLDSINASVLNFCVRPIWKHPGTEKTGFWRYRCGLCDAEALVKDELAHGINCPFTQAARSGKETT